MKAFSLSIKNGPRPDLSTMEFTATHAVVEEKVRQLVADVTAPVLVKVHTPTTVTTPAPRSRARPSSTKVKLTEIVCAFCANGAKVRKGQRYCSSSCAAKDRVAQRPFANGADTTEARG